MQIGERVKAVRTGLGLTVGALAERSGLSKALISQIENDKTSPSLTTLERLARGLDVPAAYLLLQPDEQIQVVKAEERPVYRFGADQIKVEVLSGRTARHLKAILVEFPPGTATGDESHAHGGEEFHLLLQGRLQAFQGERMVELKAGDAFHWKGCIPHRVVNPGQEIAQVLVVTSATMLEAMGEGSDFGQRGSGEVAE
jgi:transcriptional regulator with XRE-family HTH domain